MRLEDVHWLDLHCDSLADNLSERFVDQVRKPRARNGCLSAGNSSGVWDNDGARGNYDPHAGETGTRCPGIRQRVPIGL